VPAGSLDTNLDLMPEINLFAASRTSWAVMDPTIETLPGQGTAEFWAEFMARKTAQ